MKLLRYLLNAPRALLVLALVAIVAAVLMLPALQTDTSPDAFVDPDNPAREYRETVREVFGLNEPIAVAVVADGPDGIYTPSTLALIDTLTHAIQRTPNVNSQRVASIASEPLIEGSSAGIAIEDALRPLPETADAALALRERLETQDRLQGRLVARDGSAALIVAELADPDQAEATYKRVRALVDAQTPTGGERLYIAGEAALTASLASLLDREARQLIPLAAGTMVLVLFLLFRHAAGVVIPTVIAAASMIVALAMKAASGTPFYVTGNAMAVVVIAISVADAVHILTDFDARRKADPTLSRRALAFGVLKDRWQPITLTTVTTVAGFAGLWLAAGTPPARSFALFTAVGIVAAWIFTFLLLPPAMRGLPDWAFRPVPLGKLGRVVPSLRIPGAATLGRSGFGPGSRRRAGSIVVLAGVIVLAGLLGSSRVIVDETNWNNFPSDDPIVTADREINERFDGTYHMDILLEAERGEGILEPAVLRHIQEIQTYAESLPHVGGSMSIVDAIKEINRAVEDGDPEAYGIPDDGDLVTQLLLLYEMSAGSQGLRDQIDGQNRRALLRLQFDTDRYRAIAPSIEAVSSYVETTFPADGVEASVTGRMALSYHWMHEIAENHSKGVVLALALVALAGLAAFRGFRLAALALLPVAVAVVAVYGVMGALAMPLAVGTSMFAALAIGLGVDFSIHAVSALRRSGAASGVSMIDSTTRRALIWNYLTLALGFGVLATSQVPTLARFGGLVAVALTVAFLASLMLLPALLQLTGWRISAGGKVARSTAGAAVVLVALAAMGLSAERAHAEALPDGHELMEQVNARDEAETVERALVMQLIDSGGTVREREGRVYRRNTEDQRQMLLFLDAPANIAGTGFLTHDYTNAERDDDQWLYLPALRRVRRISSSDRGEYFLGTDFTFEEIKKAQKVEITDYNFTTTGEAEIDGEHTYVVEGEPVSDEIARDLGYSKVVWYVDPEIDMPRQTEFYDLAGNHLKTSYIEELREIDGILTVERVRAENHATGHSTVLTFEDTQYGVTLPERAFQQQTLRRGRF